MSLSIKTKLAIIGSGPAGLTAAIYAGRDLLNPVVIAGETPGGQLMNTTVVENYPGFPDGVDGPDLMNKMRQQAEKFEVKFIDKNATSIDVSKRPFVINAGDESVEAYSVILALGANHKDLGLANEKRLSGRGVSYCATCDGFFFRGKDIAVVGGGDSAMEDALVLTKFANSITLIHRREGFRASQIMLEKVKAHPKIKIMLNTVVEDILGDEKVSGLSLKNTQSGETNELPIDGIFIAIGHEPASKIVHGQIDVDDRGYIRIDSHFNSSVPGVFVAGDVHDCDYRQAVTAAGFGCAAEIEAERWLSENP